MGRENLMYRESLRWEETGRAGGTERSAWLERGQWEGRRDGGARGWTFRSVMWVLSEQGCSPGEGQVLSKQTCAGDAGASGMTWLGP